MAKGQLLERAGSHWLLRVYKGADPLTGKRVYDSATISGTRAEAENELASRLAGRIPRPAPGSALAEYVAWWLTIAVNPKLRAKTARDYAAHLRRYVLPRLGDHRLDSLAPPDIQCFIGDLARQGLSPRTIRYAHAILHAALEHGVKWELIGQNPAALTKLPRKEAAKIVSLTREQASRFADACECNLLGPVFLVALSTGLRPSEYLALRVKDVDFSKSRLAVERTVERHNGRWCFRETKRPVGSRTVPLPVDMVQRLATYCTKHGKLAAPERFLFEAKGRVPIHERNLVQRAFKPILKMAALPDIRLYDLRHSFATLSLSAGLPATWVSEQLGHASVAFTLEVYGHLIHDTSDQAADRLGRILFDRGTKKPGKSEAESFSLEEGRIAG